MWRFACLLLMSSRYHFVRMVLWRSYHCFIPRTMKRRHQLLLLLQSCPSCWIPSITWVFPCLLRFFSEIRRMDKYILSGQDYPKAMGRRWLVTRFVAGKTNVLLFYTWSTRSSLVRILWQFSNGWQSSYRYFVYTDTELTVMPILSFIYRAEKV